MIIIVANLSFDNAMSSINVNPFIFTFSMFFSMHTLERENKRVQITDLVRTIVSEVIYHQKAEKNCAVSKNTLNFFAIKIFL